MRMSVGRRKRIGLLNAPVSSTRKVQLGLWAVKHAKSRSGIGEIIGLFIGPRRQVREVVESRTSKGQAGWSAQGVSWMESGIGLGSDTM